MKKIFFFFIFSIFFLCCNVYADEIEKSNAKNSSEISKECEKCEECDIEDDEYCVYNQCFFDKRYRNLKRTLCLTSKQENKIDNIYGNFKLEMENLYSKYTSAKNCLLKMIECGSCEEKIKKQEKALKEIKNDIKIKLFDYKEDILEELCKTQRKDFKKFVKNEKKHFKKILKYAKVYKFPCNNSCKFD